MDINLNYTHAEKIGYGRLGVKLHEALSAAGVEVFDHMPPPPGVEFDFLGAKDRHAGTSGNVCWVAMPSHATGWWDTQHVSIFTMWEATVLPPQVRETLHHFDTVFVPSDQNVELFSRYHGNVKRVLLGVDPAEWHYRPRAEPGVFFDFLIGGAGPRKGTDLAFKAFCAAFPEADGSGPVPRLIMKNPRGEDFSFDGRVTVIAGKISPEDERDLYGSVHCYVQPSRGEGFGLQPLQAMAQGIPTILTDAHGHASFAHLGHGISATMTQADYFMYGDAGDWWEPDLDELVDTMRWVYDHYPAALYKAKAAAGVVAEDFTWARTAQQFMAGLDLSRPHVPGEWQQPKPKLYRIRLVKDWKCDIAGRRMFFRAGEDYWDVAETKRVLTEAQGLLDPECVDEADSGLTEAEVAAHRKNRPLRWWVEGEHDSPPPPPPGPSFAGERDATAWHAAAT